MDGIIASRNLVRGLVSIADANLPEAAAAIKLGVDRGAGSAARMGFGPWLYPGHSSAIREGVRLMADGIRPTRALTNDIVSAVNQLGGSRAGAAELLSTSLERIATGKLGPAGRALELGTDLARSGAIGGRALIDPAHAGALRAGARELADGSVSYGLEADIRAALSYL